ncbi:MAG: squalene/phytoene synthase family protein [Granulosicoccaceae bacterium]
MSTEILPPIGPRPGSSLYYAALYADDDTRDRCLRTLNLISIIANSLLDVQDPAVAQQKIHWWHEELDRLNNKSATHPSLIACQSIHDNHALKKHCMAVLSAAANERMSPASTEADLSAELASDYYARGALLLDGLNGEPSTPEIMEQLLPDLSTAFSYSGRLRQLRRLLHRGIAVFSDECYQQFDLQPTTLIQYVASTNPRNEKIDQLIANRVDHAAVAYAKAETTLTIDMVKNQPKLLPLLTLTRMRQQQINLWQKQRPDLLREAVTPTPVRKFWLTWRLMRKTR